MVFVDASQNAQRNPPTGEISAVGVPVTVFNLNFCTGEGFGSMTSFSSTMQLDVTETSARVYGKIPLCTFPSIGGCGEADYVLDVTWTTKVGTATRTPQTIHYFSDAGLFVSQTQGTTWSADAVGSLTRGDQNLITGPACYWPPSSQPCMVSPATSHMVTVSAVQ